MRCPTLSELPPPPAAKTGWPWTEESEQLAERMLDPSTELRASGEAWPEVSMVTLWRDEAPCLEKSLCLTCPELACNTKLGEGARSAAVQGRMVEARD